MPTAIINRLDLESNNPNILFNKIRRLLESKRDVDTDKIEKKFTKLYNPDKTKPIIPFTTESEKRELASLILKV